MMRHLSSEVLPPSTGRGRDLAAALGPNVVLVAVQRQRSRQGVGLRMPLPVLRLKYCVEGERGRKGRGR